jgi:cell division protease FtsH
MTRIAVGLGGRIAEELTFGSEGVTTGAENDLQSVTALAWRMVTHWGMGKQVGVIFADYCEADGARLHYQANNLPTHSQVSIIENQYNLSHIEENLAVNYLTYFKFGQRFIGSPTMTALIDWEVQNILNQGRETARKLQTEHYAQLTKLAQALLEHEQLNRAEFEALLSE